MVSDKEDWKTTYEVQNEMRSFERSMYPPGTAVHLPGSRDKFGYSTPGPLKHRLTNPDIALSEDVDQPAPRLVHAIPKIKVHDDRQTFMELDVPEMAKSYKSPVASATFSPMKSGMSRTKSVPVMTKTVAPKRVCEPNPLVSDFEDGHFHYFVPKALQLEPKEKLNASMLPKLHKANKISFPFLGEGTGFRSQSANTEWMQSKPYDANQWTSSSSAYTKPNAKPGSYRVTPNQPDIKPDEV
jgi:hypothetical protein